MKKGKKKEAVVAFLFLLPSLVGFCGDFSSGIWTDQFDSQWIGSGKITRLAG